jgi:hypothetical protein
VLPIREQDIQRAVFDHLRWRGMRGVFAVHVPNRRKRNSVEAAILEALVELKTKTGRLTSVQKHAMAVLERAGALTTVCRGLDPALHTLERWTLLRAGRSLAISWATPLPTRLRALSNMPDRRA